MEEVEESKVEKERRLNRVGLSYRCKVCGLPKKGHVCLGEGADGSSVETGSGKRKEAERKKSEEDNGMWDAAALLSDIRSVVSSSASKKKTDKSRPKRAREEKEETEEAFDASLLPSLITPEDAAEVAARVPRSSRSATVGPRLVGGPPSLRSSFFGSSPSVANHMPAPPLPTPGLSPATLDVLGGQVHRELRSTRRRQQELSRLASLDGPV